MRTTINIENSLIVRASELTGIKEKTKLVKLGLEALIAWEKSKRLAKLGGTEKGLTSVLEIPEVSDSDSGNLSDTYFSFLNCGFKLL